MQVIKVLYLFETTFADQVSHSVYQEEHGSPYQGSPAPVPLYQTQKLPSNTDTIGSNSVTVAIRLGTSVGNCFNVYYKLS